MTTYSIKTIDAPGEDATILSSINNVGQIVGYKDFSANNHGFEYNRGKFTNIDITSPDAVPHTTTASGINDQGRVVGNYVSTNSPSPNFDVVQGFIDDHGRLKNVSVPGGSGGVVAAINDRNVMVGYSSMGGFIDNSGKFTTLGNDVTPQGINNRGEVVGIQGINGKEVGFSDIGGKITTIDFPSLYVDLTGVNDSGAIVGISDRGSFIDTNGKMTPFAVPGAAVTNVNGINDRGQLVGNYLKPGESEAQWHGFVATPNGLPFG